ncbi:RNA polymerase sigma-70 factor, ECF subfamily [Chitinophaga sp. YR627]|uniref:sigma-70 family RNA polymerase sigma factor n=1 Tax=Chitinophaga sp. YR627 TaxID=1881041 RepID=UPI0008E1A68F|nr:sigma-70 family RNA polymerase sigma factor [Chitinophaga sp. YR627]SFM86358.1 RNA polymerase sigma-70 factor, ECF subfamily [Chitinophaga sp. YR627]
MPLTLQPPAFFLEFYPLMINEKIFTDTYELYWEKVYNVCYANLEDSELAREMVQDIFKSLWERRETLEITQSAEHYLVRAAKLKVFEYIRNQRIRSTHLKSIAYSQHTEVNFTENEILHNFLSQKLRVLVGYLPSEGREIFKLSREMGLSNKEIASTLSVSERKVEYQLMKAIRFLKSNLQEYTIYLTCIFLLNLIG